MNKKKFINIRIITVISLFSLLLVGCSTMRECEKRVGYEGILKECVGKNIRCYTKNYRDAKLNKTMQLAQNKLLYKYSLYRPASYYNGRLITEARRCKTNLTVDNASGKITNWEWEGGCNIRAWSRCKKWAKRTE